MNEKDKKLEKCISRIALAGATKEELVEELMKRDGVDLEIVRGWTDFDKPELWQITIDRGHGFVSQSHKTPGPARIIVVQGDK